MKILLIGNKDISNKLNIDGFDYIVRYNRMTNFECTKTNHTDLLLIDIGPWCHSQYSAEISKNKEKFINVNKYITFKHNSSGLNSFWDLINKKCTADIVDFESIDIKKYFSNYKWNGGYRVTNAVWMIIYLLENYKDDEIYITGIDYKDRSFLNHEHNHTHIYKEEERFLQDMIEQNKIKLL